MTRFVLIVVGMLAASTSAFAQGGDAAEIERALAAAPARGRDAAGVVRFNADHTWTTLKEGTSRLVCYDRSSDESRPAFAVQCTSVGNLERVAQSRRALAENADGEAALKVIEANGERILPEFGSVWISMNGPDQASARKHTTVAVPNATADSLGIPDNPQQGGSWIMGAGTTSAHIMTPGT